MCSIFGNDRLIKVVALRMGIAVALSLVDHNPAGWVGKKRRTVDSSDAVLLVGFDVYGAHDVLPYKSDEKCALTYAEIGVLLTRDDSALVAKTNVRAF